MIIASPAVPWRRLTRDKAYRAQLRGGLTGFVARFRVPAFSASRHPAPPQECVRLSDDRTVDVASAHELAPGCRGNLRGRNRLTKRRRSCGVCPVPNSENLWRSLSVNIESQTTAAGPLRLTSSATVSHQC